MYIKNAKFITVIFSFSKRFLICLLCIILAFNIVCKPKNAHAAALGTVATWGLAEYLAALVSSAGLAITINELLEGLGIFENKDKPVSEDQALNWCKNNISVDGDNNVVFTDDAKLFISSYILGTYSDNIQMTYRYFFNPDNVDFSIIENKDVRDELIRVMKEYPHLHFVCWGRVTEVGHGTAFWLGINNDLEYAVSLNNNLGILTRNKVFTSNWNNPIPNAKICLLDSGRDDDLYWGYMPVTNPNAAVWNVSFDDIYKLYTDDKIASSTYSADTLSELTLASSKTNKVVFGVNQCVISSDSSAINCYKSEADMKKDTGNYKVGNYIPDYTGQPNYNITTSEVNNIVNNYYNDSDGGSGSGGSGSDDSGSSSGIFGGLAKIVGAIVNGIASIIDAIVAPIERIISSIVGLFKDFIEAIMSFADLYDSNIPLFFKDVFSFLPDKLVTVLTTSLILVIIVAVIKFIRG